MKIRNEIMQFAEEMEIKLRENDHKGGWEHCNYSSLIEKLEQEIQEIKELFTCKECSADTPYPSSYLELIREAADVANYAMMIADNAKREYQ